MERMEWRPRVDRWHSTMIGSRSEFDIHTWRDVTGQSQYTHAPKGIFHDFGPLVELSIGATLPPNIFGSIEQKITILRVDVQIDSCEMSTALHVCISSVVVISKLCLKY